MSGTGRKLEDTSNLGCIGTDLVEVPPPWSQDWLDQAAPWCVIGDTRVGASTAVRCASRRYGRGPHPRLDCPPRQSCGAVQSGRGRSVLYDVIAPCTTLSTSVPFPAVNSEYKGTGRPMLDTMCLGELGKNKPLFLMCKQS